MTLLLDTCAFLWLALEPQRLSSTAASLIDDPENELLLSETSVWKIVLKHSAGKLPLPDPPRNWIPTRRAFFGLQSLPITESALFRSGELPKVHADPFDRLLAAQAIELTIPVVTPDVPFERLGAQRRW